LFLLVGCSDNAKMQRNINEFTSNCEQLAKCMELPYKVKTDITDNKLRCSLSINSFSNTHLHPENGLDLTKYEKWGYDFLESAITICQILKEKGSYTKEDKNRRARHAKCVQLDPDSKDQRQACWEQYKNDDGTLDEKEECDINCKLEKISKIKKD